MKPAPVATKPSYPRAEAFKLLCKPGAGREVEVRDGSTIYLYRKQGGLLPDLVSVHISHAPPINRVTSPCTMALTDLNQTHL